jgi:hypothetical protein
MGSVTASLIRLTTPRRPDRNPQDVWTGRSPQRAAAPKRAESYLDDSGVARPVRDRRGDLARVTHQGTPARQSAAETHQVVDPRRPKALSPAATFGTMWNDGEIESATIVYGREGLLDDAAARS